MPIAIAALVPTPSPASPPTNNLSDEPHASIPHADSSDPLAESEQAGTPVESSSFNAEISDSAADLLGLLRIMSGRLREMAIAPVSAN